MADNLTLSIKDSLERLEKTLLDIPLRLESEFKQAVNDLAHAAHAEIVAEATAKLSSTRQDYLKALQFEQIGPNEYLIHLDSDWAQALESGYPSYDLTEKLLRSKKTVDVGSRSGESWVQQAKDGHKFAHVPLEKKPFSKASKHADLAEAIKGMTAKNAKGRSQKLTRIFKGVSGQPLEGKVAIGRSDNPILDGLVKYQKVYQHKGKETVQSTYINYRTISEIAKHWIHPGFSGVKIFQKAGRKIESEMDKIVRTLLG